MWYTVSILFRSDREDGSPLWEDQIVLFTALNEDDARLKGEQFGRAEEISFRSASGNDVIWTFSHVERVFLVESDSLCDKTVIFSRFLRDSEVSSLLKPFDD